MFKFEIIRSILCMGLLSLGLGGCADVQYESQNNSGIFKTSPRLEIFESKGHHLSVVKILTEDIETKQNFGCSGALVGERIVLTAAHCIRRALTINEETEKHQISSKISVYARYRQKDSKGNDLQVEAKVTRLQFPGLTKFVTSSDFSKDWAVLEIDKPLGKTYGWLGVKGDVQKDHHDDDLELLGYPGDIQSSTVLMSSGNCKIREHSSINHTMRHDCSIWSGNSGGPIVKKINGSYFIVGLVVSSNFLRETKESYDGRAWNTAVNPRAYIATIRNAKKRTETP